MNAALTTIRSQAQHYFMKNLEIASNAWIGLSDSTQEGNWSRNNGDVTKIRLWGFNQPDAGVLENCAVINISDAYLWHSLPCSSTNDYVCEKGNRFYISLIFNWYAVLNLISFGKLNVTSFKDWLKGN